MSSVVYYTSISFSYLNRARVLAQSLKRHDPGARLVVIMTDREPEGFKFDLSQELFDEVIWTHALDMPSVYSWLFKHDVVELCTAVKGPVLCSLLEQAECVIYLDPDTCVFASLKPLVDLLQEFDVVLTPHQLTPDTEETAIIDNEICSLRTGIYNLGFVAVRASEEGKRFAKWWSDRLLRFCYDDIPNGLFVDQRWCDFAPVFFDRVKILRDPGYNVASWNLSQRKIAITEGGEILVNGHPLRFWHFSKLGPLGETMTSRYAKDNTEVYELWWWYKQQITRFTEPAIPRAWWYYGMYENREPIPREARLLYRSRPDIQERFPNPFVVSSDSFYEWMASEANT